MYTVSCLCSASIETILFIFHKHLFSKYDTHRVLSTFLPPSHHVHCILSWAVPPLRSTSLRRVVLSAKLHKRETITSFTTSSSVLKQSSKSSCNCWTLTNTSTWHRAPPLPCLVALKSITDWGSLSPCSALRARFKSGTYKHAHTHTTQTHTHTAHTNVRITATHTHHT